jgi:phage terminase large subunit GpA-like protein
MSVSEWADAKRMLSSESSASPGRWKTRIVEPMREPMDMTTRPDVHRVVIVAAAQVAKTESILNIIGYHIDHDPSPMLVVQPTLEMAHTFSKDRLAPMIRDTSDLAEKVSDTKARDSGNTITHKVFPGGHVTMIGANSPVSLASRPIRILCLDEVDRYPSSAGTEGDPVKLAIKRTATFWNRVVVLVSTPTVKNASRIMEAYEEGDQRQWFSRCPHCGEYQVFKWSNVRWDDRKASTAYYLCEHSGCVLTNNDRVVAVRDGEWRTDLPFTGIVSYHVNGLMSPFASLEDGVREFLEARGNIESMKTWVNTYLGEAWEDQGERVDYHDLFDRREDFGDGLPEGVTMLTAGVDVQDDRIEMEVVGWGDDHESWSIAYHRIYGDPSGPNVWSELTKLRDQIYNHSLFGEMTLRNACVDSGGHFTQTVYNYTKGRVRIMPVKGVGGEGKPLIGRPTKNNIGKVQLFPVGANTAKELVFSRLRAKFGDAGYCHFPDDRDEEYFHQLTAEEARQIKNKGFTRTEYVKIRSRNEALDCRVYATAALEVLGIDLKATRRAMTFKRLPTKAPDVVDKATKIAKRGNSYVNRWKNW